MGSELAIWGTAGTLVLRVLGPTAGLLGRELEEWTGRRIENVKRILANADSKIPEGTDPEAPVPPRVLARVVMEGSFSEDPIAVEYLGGVLASSKAGVSRDDRGATWSALVTRLSSYELRAHYVMYSIAHRLFQGGTFSPGVQSELTSREIFISLDSFIVAMDYDEDERARWGVLSAELIWGLYKESLLDQHALGSAEHLRATKRNPRIPKPGLVFAPTITGIRLFLWAHGLGNEHVRKFLDPDPGLEVSNDVNIPLDFSLVRDLPQPQ